ncbi:DUF4394 domain-containing protein [Streptomyces sp. A012304]|uniref:DUF4394 domain-containing protein n=1 Tax=Streptomyces sp. A012304 TaxID=375446 RepID=UPI0022315582|nr:DUF4394 domain-containing protein [Streptomyces sp. A012304]GKQ39063.1 hypothetical protein ALMP_55920 [Streptomyces sp. A012304]
MTVDFNPAADRLRVISDNGATRPSLYSINLFTGEATLVSDALGSRFPLNITDLAISLTGS